MPIPELIGGSRLKGRAKESVGAATGDEDLKNDGQTDQGSSAVKKGAEKAKDTANRIAGKFTGKN